MTAAMAKTAGRSKPKATGVRFRRRTKRLLGWGAVALGLLVIGAGLTHWLSNRPGSAVPSLGNAHLQSPDDPHVPYNSDPPTSGPHLGYIAPWGIHTKPIPKELQVHNLEDGGILVQYCCPRGCPDLVQRLTAIVTRYREHTILAPYPDMDRTIALTAWGRIDKLDVFDENRVGRFIEAYRGIDHHARSGFQ
jgi:hypothetical protein